MIEPVTVLYESHLRDIVGCMRATADAIERGDFGEVDHAVFALVGRDGGLEAFGWGARSDALRDAGLFNCAAMTCVRSK